MKILLFKNQNKDLVKLEMKEIQGIKDKMFIFP
ncbi:MAG: hypothetical protein RIS64_595 [Bacteroidota bacterium]|jgi:hypothetical protein